MLGTAADRAGLSRHQSLSQGAADPPEIGSLDGLKIPDGLILGQHRLLPGSILPGVAVLCFGQGLFCCGKLLPGGKGCPFLLLQRGIQLPGIFQQGDALSALFVGLTAGIMGLLLFFRTGQCPLGSFLLLPGLGSQLLGPQLLPQSFLILQILGMKGLGDVRTLQQRLLSVKSGLSLRQSGKLLMQLGKRLKFLMFQQRLLAGCPQPGQFLLRRFGRVLKLLRQLGLLRDFFFQGNQIGTAIFPKLCGDLQLFLLQRRILLRHPAVDFVGDALPAVRVEEAHQNLFLFHRIRHQQLFKLPLGQYDDLAELVVGQADQLLGLLVHYSCLGIFKYGHPHTVLENQAVVGII